MDRPFANFCKIKFHGPQPFAATAHANLLADCCWHLCGNQTRHSIEVSQSSIFMVQNESTKTVKITCLENLALYNIARDPRHEARYVQEYIYSWYVYTYIVPFQVPLPETGTYIQYTEHSSDRSYQ